MSQLYIYPNPSSSANPSVGTNGTSAPTSSTEIGIIDGTGKLQGVSDSNPLPITLASGINPLPVQDVAAEASLASIDSKVATETTLTAVLSAINAQIDIANSIWTDDTGVYYVRVQESQGGVITVVFQTPTGSPATPGTGLRPAASASIEIVQSLYNAIASGTGYSVNDLISNALVINIDTPTPTILASIWFNITTSSAISAPASADIVQVTQNIAVTSSVLPTGASTSALQTSGNSSLSSILANQTNGTQVVTGPLTDAQLRASAVPVSVGVLPLPSGAATEATLSALNAKVTIADTSNVTIASSALPTGASTSANQTNGTQKTQIVDGSGNVIGSFSNRLLVAPGYTANINAAMPSLIGVIGARNQSTGNASPLQLNASNYLLTSDIAAENSLSSIDTKTSAIQTSVASIDSKTTVVDTSNIAGTVAVSNFPANQDVNVNGKTPVNLPIYNDYSITPVTTSAYVELIASTAADISQVKIFDSSGQAMILAVGSAGLEVDLYYIPPGGDTFEIAIPASTRLSYKALTGNASSGYLLINLLG